MVPRKRYENLSGVTNDLIRKEIHDKIDRMDNDEDLRFLYFVLNNVKAIRLFFKAIREYST